MGVPIGSKIIKVDEGMKIMALSQTEKEQFDKNNPWWLILGVKRNVTLEVLKDTYRGLLENYHPDKNPDRIKDSTLITAIINGAYDKGKSEKTENNGYANTEDSDSGNGGNTKNANDYDPHARFDYGKYRKSGRVKIEESKFWDKELDFATNWCNVLEKFVYLPSSDIQLPVLKAFSLLPSAMALQNLPTLFLSGLPDTGKSRILSILGFSRGVGVVNVLSTYASLRNQICERKYGSIQGGDIERNTILLFDNLTKDTLKNNEGVYMLLNQSYDRSASIITISGGANEGNIKFDVFGLVAISSVWSLDRDSRYVELSTRMVKLFTESSKGHKIERTSKYNFDGLQHLYKQYWEDDAKLNKYVDLQEKIGNLLEQGDYGLTSRQWVLISEAIVTGLVCGIWSTPEQAIDNFVKQFELDRIYIRESPLEVCIREILEEFNKPYEGNASIGKSDVVPPSVISQAISEAIKYKTLDYTEVSTGEISRIMAMHGYRLVKSKWKLRN